MSLKQFRKRLVFPGEMEYATDEHFTKIASKLKGIISRAGKNGAKTLAISLTQGEIDSAIDGKVRTTDIFGQAVACAKRKGVRVIPLRSELNISGTIGESIANYNHAALPIINEHKPDLIILSNAHYDWLKASDALKEYAHTMLTLRPLRQITT